MRHKALRKEGGKGVKNFSFDQSGTLGRENKVSCFDPDGHELTRTTCIMNPDNSRDRSDIERRTSEDV